VEKDSALGVSAGRLPTNRIEKGLLARAECPILAPLRRRQTGRGSQNPKDVQSATDDIDL